MIRQIAILKTSAAIVAGVMIGSPREAAAKPDAAYAAYNDGVGRLATNDLREAETAFRSTVQSNHEKLQPVALYNLGHVRFLQGKEILQGEGNRQQLLDSSEAAIVVAEEVIRRLGPKSESEDVRELISAYMEARATRKQLRMARVENTRELDLIGSALARWHRSVGDFRSAHELNPADTDAAFNADVVQRHIDEILIFIKKVKMQQEAISEERAKLTQMMKGMRGKIPKEMQRGSDDEEEDEEEDGEGGQGQEEQEPSSGEQPSQQQQRIGSDREIDSDMLRVLKEKMPQRTMSVGQEGESERGIPRNPQGFRPDGQRQGEPRGRKGKDW